MPEYPFAGSTPRLPFTPEFGAVFLAAGGDNAIADTVGLLAGERPFLRAEGLTDDRQDRPPRVLGEFGAVTIVSGSISGQTETLPLFVAKSFDQFDEQADMVSVDHPHVVENYRAAHAISQRAGQGQANTEQLRQAFVHYRSLFEELLGESHTSRQ